MLFASVARAQTPNSIAALRGLGVDDDVIGLFAGKRLDVARIIAAILKIEIDADRRALPNTALAFKPAGDSGATLPTTEGGLYAAAVPRLIHVMDRADGRDSVLADEAGRLLSELNEGQRDDPEALRFTAVLPSRATSFTALKAEYADYFSSVALRADRSELANWHKRVLIEYRPRYEAVASETGVPWFFIGAIHGLEASYNFRAHFHNGDFPLSARTRQVPANRPVNWREPYRWEASAKDALQLMNFSGKSDWTLERTLYRLEAYNGFGYRRRGIPSPYLWSFSNHYDQGKFVSDGRWNPAARSQQCGAATIMKLLLDDGAISFA